MENPFKRPSRNANRDLSGDDTNANLGDSAASEASVSGSTVPLKFMEESGSEYIPMVMGYGEEVRVRWLVKGGIPQFERAAETE